MARAKGTGKKRAPAGRSAARPKATPPTAPRARDEKRAIIYPRIGFEEVGTEVATEWQKTPEVLRRALDPFAARHAHIEGDLERFAAFLARTIAELGAE